MSDPSNKTIQVLLIDDHRSVLWGLEKLIDSQKPKMQVIGKFTSYAEASLQIERLLPDLILLDLDLGIEQGIDIIPQLTQISNAKILILTGSRDTDLQDKAIIAGASGVIEKESPAELILSAIERVHQGQLWMANARMGNIIAGLSQKKSAQENSPEQKQIESLTTRERHVISAMTANAGATGSDVAKQLNISESTLRNHLSSIYTKLGLTNRLELWDFAHTKGLNKPPQ